MIPVHIWHHRRLGRLEGFANHFYEVEGGRNSIYGRPVVRSRSGKLDYYLAGQFSKYVLLNSGKPSIHIFILTSEDLLPEAPNNSLGQVCASIMKVAQTCPSVITIFLNLIEPQFLSTHETITQSTSLISLTCEQTPKIAAYVKPAHFGEGSVRDTTIWKERIILFQELIDNIASVKIKDKEIKICPIERNRCKNVGNIPLGLE